LPDHQKRILVIAYHLRICWGEILKLCWDQVDWDANLIRLEKRQTKGKKALERAGIPGLLIHDLRRTAVRNMIRAGISEKRAMEISGHKTNSMFKRYDITDERDNPG
jgi:integrase